MSLTQARLIELTGQISGGEDLIAWMLTDHIDLNKMTWKQIQDLRSYHRSIVLPKLSCERLHEFLRDNACWEKILSVEIIKQPQFKVDDVDEFLIRIGNVGTEKNLAAFLDRGYIPTQAAVDKLIDIVCQSDHVGRLALILEYNLPFTIDKIFQIYTHAREKKRPDITAIATTYLRKLVQDLDKANQRAHDAETLLGPYQP